MISPINGLKLKNTLKSASSAPLKNQKFEEKQNITNPNKVNSIYSNNISFRGYVNIKPKMTFQDTVDDNYFQLPSVELSDGSIFQFKPDESQLECARAIYNGDSLLFNAPTGTGKTAPMHYAATKNLKEGKKTLIVIPLKSLANDKYREFSRIYGEDNVGLLTGDIKIHPNAPITIMTAEIYNNMAPSMTKTSDRGTVIFDEAHYLSDYDRGSVWEYSLINTPQRNFQTVALSATIGNDKDFALWLTMLNPAREVKEVKVDSSERYVPLIHYVYEPQGKVSGKFIPIVAQDVKMDDINPDDLTPRQKRAFEVIYKASLGINEPVKLEDSDYQTLAKELENCFAKENAYKISKFEKLLHENYQSLSKEQLKEVGELLSDPKTKQVMQIEVEHEHDNWGMLIDDMKRENMLPAIIFRLSRKGCQDIQRELYRAKVDLTDNKEKEQIRKILDDYKQKGIYLGNYYNECAILNGYACHHAGELPGYKKLVEELYSKKLLKVVLATSTLSAGINMPTKSTVIVDVMHPEYDPIERGLTFKPLSASEMQQMCGRAGRRGIDNIGNVILYINTSRDSMNSEEMQEDALTLAYSLIEAKPDNLTSNLKPDWALLANCFNGGRGENEINHLIDYSFKMFTSDDPVLDEAKLKSEFQKHENVLLKLGYIKKDDNGSVSITPKGKILKMSQTMNPLLLSSLVYDEKLDNISPVDLCQIAGHLASSDEQKEDKNMPSLITKMLKEKMLPEYDFKKELPVVADVSNMVKNTEHKLISAQRDEKIKNIIYSDTFGGFCTYLFASANQINSDSVDNFIRITGRKKQAIDKKTALRWGDAASEFNRKAQEGNIYKVLAQSCSIVKRIEDICDFALSNPDLYPNQAYYENLKKQHSNPCCF